MNYINSIIHSVFYIFEAGLFDLITVSGGNVFAIRNTTATSPNPGIDVNDGDTLDVTWTITIG